MPEGSTVKLLWSTQMLRCGVLYIAFGEQHRREALASVAALRRFHPDLPCCVIAESEFDDLPSHVELLLREPAGKYPLRVKARYLRESPFDRTLFLDTDTTTVRPIEGLFHLLDRFDIGLYMLPYYTDHPKYRYLNNPSSGVVLFRRCEAVSETFDRWLELFDQEVSMTEARASNSPSRINDDPLLMRAIYETQARLVPLPAAMNFHLDVPTVTASPIHIVHGRHPDPVGLARRVDQGRPAGLPNWNPRVWVPQLQSPLPDGSLRSPAIWLRAPLYALHAVVSRLWALASVRYRMLR
jgi:hypothetical protein